MSQKQPDTSASTTNEGSSQRSSRLFWICSVLGFLSLALTTTISLSSASPFVKPYHHGRVVYSVESDDAGRIVYKREFTVPCGDGLLVFNVGTAPEYAPYFYDVYEDAYAFSDNSGLCLLYPSWQGLQQAYHKLWETNDLTAYTVNLGDTPNKISSRVVRPTGSKEGEAKRGGDYVIMRPHDFYTPAYYQRLKDEVNKWTQGVDIQTRLEMWLEEQEQWEAATVAGKEGNMGRGSSGVVIAIEEHHHLRSTGAIDEATSFIDQA